MRLKLTIMFLICIKGSQVLRIEEAVEYMILIHQLKKVRQLLMPSGVLVLALGLVPVARITDMVVQQ